MIAQVNSEASFAIRQRGNYDVVVAMFVAFLLISNIAAVKLFQVGPEFAPFDIPILPIITDGGALLFPLTYILGDVLAEVYGIKGARRAIILGFAASIVASVTFLAVGAMPPAEGWENQEAFLAILGFVPRIVAASLVAYFVGQLLNAWVLVKIKERAGESRLWVRLLGSSAVGTAADTILFCTIAFAGEIPFSGLVNYIIYGYIYKMTLETVLLPVTYRVIALVKRHEPTYTAAS